MINFCITMTGTAPLLMHNSRLANPLDPVAKSLKKVTGKRTRTDDDYEEGFRIEHAGSLYFDPDVGPYLPSDNVWRCLFDAGGKHKVGRSTLSTSIKTGVMFPEVINPLSYPGPRDVDGLWKDENFRHIASIKIGKNRSMRCRPIFQQWRVAADGILDPNILDLADLVMIAGTAGSLIGLGDWRPRFGRFEATVEKV